MKRIGIYAGSFNPFHVGHLHIAQEAQRIFDEVHVVWAGNPEKNPSEKFPVPVAFLEKRNFKVYEHSGLITKLFAEDSYNEMTMIRGLRNGYDLQYESNYRKWVNEISPVNFIYICCPANLEHVSSSELRTLYNLPSPEGKRVAERYII
jgi:pantetheine-phosphate adenylyltransferase